MSDPKPNPIPPKPNPRPINLPGKKPTPAQDPDFMPTLLPAHLLPPEEKVPAPAAPTQFGIEETSPPKKPTVPPPAKAAPPPAKKPAPPRTEQVPAEAAAPPKKMRRWKKILLWTGGICAALFLIVLLFGPMIIAPIVRSKVVAVLNEKLNGTTELDEFSFGWTGNVHVGGLRVKDSKGEVILSTKKVDISASVMSAIGGSYIADVTIEDPVIVVRHQADGSFNLMALMKAEPVKPDRDATKSDRPKKDEKLPTVKAKVTVTGGRVTFFHEDGRSTQLTDLAAKLTIDTLDKPIAFDASLAGIGTVKVKGEITVAKEGKLDLDHLHGPVGLTFTDINLAKLLPVVAAFSPLAKLDGRVNGKVDYELTSMTSAKGGGGLELRGLDVAGGPLPNPVKLDLIKLTHTIDLDGEGTGTATVRLDVGDFLGATVVATMTRILTEMGSTDATITADAKLKELTQTLGSLLQMKQDYTLDGRATLKTIAKVAVGVRSKLMGSAQVDVAAKLENLSAKDDKGQPLPIDPTATMTLKGAFDPGKPISFDDLADPTKLRGQGKLESCEIHAGTVAVTARGGADLKKLSFSDSVLKVDADLDDVAKKVEFMKLGFSFGGKVHIDSTLEGTGEIARAVSTVRVSALKLIGFQGKNLGPIDLTMDAVANIDLRPGGKSTLDSFKLVSGLVDADAKGEATDAMEMRKIAGSATVHVKAYPAAINEKLGDFLMGYTLSGTDLLVWADATFRGTDMTAKGDFKTRDLVVHGPTLGPGGATLKDVSVLYNVACNYETLDADIRDITMECGIVDVALNDPAMAAGVKNVTAKLSGSKKGDILAITTDAKIREVTASSAAFNLKSSKIADIALDGDVSANLKTFDAGSKGFTLTVKAADAAMSDMSATIHDIVAKLSGSKKGDDIVAKADVKIRDVVAMTPQLGPKGAVVADISLDCDVTANLKTFDADAKRAVFTIATIDAWMKDSSKPASVRGFNVTCNGTKKGDVLDLVKLDLKSSLAQGNGNLKVTNLMKEGMVANGEFDFHGDIAPLVDLAKIMMPDLKDAVSSGTWRFSANVLTQGNQIQVMPLLKIEQMSLTGYKVGETPLKLEKVDIILESNTLIDTQGTGKATIQVCQLLAPGAGISANGTASGFLATPMKLEATLRITAGLQPTKLNDRLSAFLMGYKLEGQDVKAIADVTVNGETYTAKGNLKAPKLVITMPPADPKTPKPEPTVITQTNMVVEFDIVADMKPTEEHIEIKKCTYVSQTATATVEGEINGLGDKMSANVTLKADAELAQVQKDLGAMMGLPKDYELTGKATATFDVGGRSGKLDANGGGTIENFTLTVPGDKPGTKVTVTEPTITMTCEAVVTMIAEVKRGMRREGRTDVELKKAGVKSSFVNGTSSGVVRNVTGEMEFVGMKGDFAYIPDKMGAMLQPWLFGGKLTGAEEQKISFTLDGKAKDFDPIVMLRNSTGGASLGIGLFTMTGLSAKGGMDVKIQPDQHATTTTTLGVNGGLTDMKLDVDLREPQKNVQPVSTATFTLKKVAANGEMSPLLQLIHPMFAITKGTVDGMIAGSIDTSLDIQYRAGLSTPLLMSFSKEDGWRNFDKTPINGRGHFEISGLGLKGAPFIAALLGALEIGTLDGLDLNPIDFYIQEGRLHYANPVRMKISGQVTHWTGSIALDDRSNQGAKRLDQLDLYWEIPVSDKLVSKYGFLKYWAGKTITVHVTGKAMSPHLEWKELMADLAKQAAQKAIEEKGKDVLDGLLGKDEKKAKGLLEDADKLYDQGKKADAAALYKKIHEEYKKTRVYENNKDRIKARELEK